MALRKPTVMINGVLRDLPVGDTISVPNAGTDVISGTNGEATAVAIGTVSYLSAAGTFRKAQANAVGTAEAAAMVLDTTIANAAVGQFATDGFVTATTGQWDAVTGQTGGLTPLGKYYLDPSTAGRMTVTAPTSVGQYVVYIGRALSTVDFEMNVGQPYPL